MKLEYLKNTRTKLLLSSWRRGEGFEPPMRPFGRITALAGCCLKPLSHLSRIAESVASVARPPHEAFASDRAALNLKAFQRSRAFAAISTHLFGTRCTIP